jgi:CRP-like cAMP-binding protein
MLDKIISAFRPRTIFDNDYLYSQGDQAEEIYFVISGEFILLMDLAD